VVVVGIDVEGVTLDEVVNVEVVVVVGAGMVTAVVSDPAPGSPLSTNGVGKMRGGSGTTVPSIPVVVVMSAGSSSSSSVTVFARTSG